MFHGPPGLAQLYPLPQVPVSHKPCIWEGSSALVVSPACVAVRPSLVPSRGPWTAPWSSLRRVRRGIAVRSAVGPVRGASCARARGAQSHLGLPRQMHERFWQLPAGVRKNCGRC